ncbi:MAG: 1-deoxy-D-xylulose-5-phosphate synthase [Candidatus Omnitrophica bacterium]|nr:1-deoxy-D-xylulose-5-phosphate synthase [Candidatus Omnitrophota bacterium]
MRNTFIECLIERSRSDKRVFIITADMGFSVFEKFMKEFPDRFLNVGIAEQNAIGVAAGLALSGRVVYVYSIIPFITMRCFEQVRLDLAYMNLNVRLIGVGAGFSYGAQGPTHHAIEDIAIMRSLPNMTVCCPGDPLEARELIKHSFDYQGPIYFRLGKNQEPNIHNQKTKIRIGQAIKITQGKDVALITTSTMLKQGLEWVQGWAKKGIKATFLSMPTLKPLDRAAILKLINQGLPIITLEEHNIIGGLGSAVAEVIAESGKPVRFKRVAIPDQYSREVGNQEFLKKKSGLRRIPSF